jgi:hypothetical protein
VIYRVGREWDIDLDRVETNTTPVGAPAVPLSGVWRTIRSYILWSYERGTIQYDVMVTLILLFVFFSPQLINFKDKPVEHNPHRTGVVVIPDEQGGLIYQVEGSAVTATDNGVVRSQLLQVIEPISGEVNITKIEPVCDRSGHVLQYKVWVERE